MIELKGITWNHPRGLDGLAATAAEYHTWHPEVQITWQTRSLQDFADFSVERLAERFDLVIYDHPFVGEAAALRCFLPLDEHLEAAFLEDQARHSAGASHRSYQWDGHQWALAVDAACQVSAYRPDLLAAIDAIAAIDPGLPATWDEVLALAAAVRRHGRWIATPLIPVDSLMCLYTLCANAAGPGEEPCATPDCFVGRPLGRYALELLERLHAAVHPGSPGWNPPALLDHMAREDDIVYCPLAFGYTNYGRAGFRPQRVLFADIPSAGRGPAGAVLGGAGLGVSARAAHPDEACAYAASVASAGVQRTTYVAAGGQPGHRGAWLDPGADALAGGFFAATLATIDASYLRPRHRGYVAFQDQGFALIYRHLNEHGDVDATLDELDALYRASIQTTKSPGR
jgi:multiple sugar transport system substrate-binding protein